MWTERERARERREFLYGTVLERGVTSLFLASERERGRGRCKGRERENREWRERM